MSIIAALVLIAIAFAVCVLLNLAYVFCGDPRYDEDGIGTIVRLFQCITFSCKPATAVPRREYVIILKRYIENFNTHRDEIVGNSEFIKEEVYKRMTNSDDYKIFNKVAHLMTLIANGLKSQWRIFEVFWYLHKSGVRDVKELIMKISLAATLCTLLCLPDAGTRNLLEKASHYELIRCRKSSPFLGISACPMIHEWRTIKLPKICNTDTNLVLSGGIIKYF